MRVLLVGHACGPNQGSEPGLTWNWAWHLAADHEVWVMAHPERRAQVERFLAAQPNPRLHVVWVTLPRRWDPWKPERGQGGIRLHYLIWQRLVLREAARLHRVRPFDVAHHVGWGTVSAPPLLWQLPVPFVWGPIGGGQSSPAAFRRYFGRASRREALRHLRVQLLPLLPGLRQAAQRSAVILATNDETAKLLEAVGAREVRLFADNGLPPSYIPAAPPRREPGKSLTLLWAGQLEPRKALPLALEALARAPDLPVRLVVAGKGSMRAEWEGLAERLGLRERVEFLGYVPWDEMPRLFQQADAFLFTSLRDSFGSVVLEAMAHALPIVTLDLHGVGRFVPSDAGVKVPVTGPAETVEGLARAVRRLVESPELRRRMGEVAWTRARLESWDQRAAQMTRWYEECLRG